MEITNEVYAQNRLEWRTWLQEHYQHIREAYLIYYKKSTGMPSLTYEESVEEALCFGWIDGVRKSIDGKRYKMRFTPRRSGSIWSLINRERVEKLIQEGKMTAAGLKLVEEAKQNGQWDAAYSMKGEQEIPPDLKAALLENPQAWENFSNFSNSIQFTFIYRIKRIKSANLRAEKIRKAIELCKKNLKPSGPDRKPRL